MSKFQQVQESLSGVLSRTDLEKLRKEIECDRETDRTLKEVCEQIDAILGNRSISFAGLDNQYIQDECHRLSRQLQKAEKNPPFSLDAETVIQSLQYFEENGLVTRFFRTNNQKCKYGQNEFSILRPDNEYDVQHLLYSFFRVLFPSCRMEVVQDDGYRSVRSDIYLSEDIIVEVKSMTRNSLTESRLAEEICADGVRFDHHFHFYFIYDPNMQIFNPESFKSNYIERLSKKTGKVIRIFICNE